MSQKFTSLFFGGSIIDLFAIGALLWMPNTGLGPHGTHILNRHYVLKVVRKGLSAEVAFTMRHGKDAR